MATSRLYTLHQVSTSSEGSGCIQRADGLLEFFDAPENDQPCPTAATNCFCSVQEVAVIAWGQSGKGAAIPAEVLHIVKGRQIVKIYPTCCAFALLLDDGDVVAWG